MRRLILMALIVLGGLLAACASLVAPGARPPHDDARLIYQIEVTAPGTRSQGWHGVLYDTTGAPIQLAPGSWVETPAGRFRAIGCQHLWSTCGAIEDRMLRWMEQHEHNVIMRETWLYRVYARGNDQIELVGELLRDGTRVEPGRDVETPMGPFRWSDGAAAPERRGWWHAAWEG